VAEGEKLGLREERWRERYSGRRREEVRQQHYVIVKVSTS
jgi:hypothetical protein